MPGSLLLGCELGAVSSYTFPWRGEVICFYQGIQRELSGTSDLAICTSLP